MLSFARSFSSRMAAPRIAGIERIKEYFTANFLSNPQNVHAEIVVPEREIPGSVANPCAIPIRIPSPQETSFGIFQQFSTRSDRYRIMPVIRRQIPGTIRVEEASSISFLPKYPISPVGIVETMTRATNLR